jgi:hypothetical protein
LLEQDLLQYDADRSVVPRASRPAKNLANKPVRRAERPYFACKLSQQPMERGTLLIGQFLGR